MQPFLTIKFSINISVYHELIRDTSALKSCTARVENSSIYFEDNLRIEVPAE